MKDIHSRVPVNITAARVAQFKGVHFESKKRIKTNDSDFPIAIRKPLKQDLNNPQFKDLTGVRFGRFLVLGISRDFGGNWVVRCDCGKYTTRRSKAILNPNNVQDRCEECRELAHLKRHQHWREYGKDIDIREL